MGDRDAFGREYNENTLAGLGWTDGGSESQPVPLRVEPSKPLARAHGLDVSHVNRAGVPGTHAPDRHQIPDSPVAGTGLPNGREVVLVGAPLRSLLRLIATVAFIAVLTALIVGGSSVVDTISDEVKKLDTAPSPSVQAPVPRADRVPSPGANPVGPGRPATTPTGLGRGSLLARANFSAAVRTLRASGKGRLVNLRVAPDRINVQLLTRGGRLRNAVIRPGGALEVSSTSAAGFSSSRTMSIAGLDPAAPARLTRSAAGRLKRPAGRVDYLVYSESFGTTGSWFAYFKGGPVFMADSRGAITRRIQ